MELVFLCDWLTEPLDRFGLASLDRSARRLNDVGGFTRVSSMELGTFGITVNAVCPGIIQAEMGKNNLREPEPVAFFASDDSAFVTGQALNVDGGIFYS